MSLLFDQNLSWRLVHLLAAEYPGAEHVRDVGLARADDNAVWAYAAAKGLTVVSKDEDFRNVVSTLGFPPKFIWLRVGNGPSRDVDDLLRNRRNDVLAFLLDPAASTLELP